MVVFIDLEHDAFNKHRFPRGPETFFPAYPEHGKPPSSKLTHIGPNPPTPAAADVVPKDDDPPVDPTTHDAHCPETLQQQSLNRNAFSAALSCYPIIKEIARAVDLNTLHALSRACRQFHANLSPYRPQLVKQTLRCENEYIETLSDLLDSGAAIPESIKSVIQLMSRGPMSSGRLTSGKVAKCARDMVAECRRCCKVVCRNCTAKPVTSSMFKNRIRRLCRTCRDASLSEILAPFPHDAQIQEADPDSFTAQAFLRTPCTCQSAVWLCHPCGQKIRSDDTTYRRVWTWRTRYSTYLGGLGTGIGEGCQGVKCGRGEDCIAAQEIELEVECEADESANTPPETHHGTLNHRLGNSRASSPSHANDWWDSREEEEPGYFRQEIIGIGGRVKQKAKKRIMVGACVVEHEDEREKGEYLGREEDGQHRSWCGWCWRVIPARHERIDS
ncbi:hypothetical protein FE257_002898 [Aspergillus nanangensis]|uniref:Uncharacterized protein n=1 Tax=Aspergillus nanangensis TaxID=2582783 RepID=A0AAD4CSL3_ASPNN|nr:hypothetical protein FE257_002898 [Aspergillus nanangensis]